MHALARAAPRVDSEHVLLLKGLLLFAVIIFACLAAWHYGLVQEVWSADRTGVSVAITLVFTLAAAHGALHLLRLSRQLNHVDAVERFVAHRGVIAYRRAIDGAGQVNDLPDGCVTAHARNLIAKARLGGQRPVDQRLLLEGLETDLRRGHALGWFVADLLLSLGLLGTVIGFILMLAPISSLDTQDHAAIKDALATMSGGMAVALYTTLTGLIGGMLLKVLGLMLDGAVDEIVRRTTGLTEVQLIPAIERNARDPEPGHATA